MTTVTMRTASGGDSGTVELDATIFGIEPNTAVMHQVVVAQLAARRSGTHSTKTRAEVRGGGAKPWRQKGTGRARQGSIRSPQWRGGGVAHGPKPRSYEQRTPKKMKRLALHSALSDRAAEGKVLVVDEWGFDEPKTKAAVALLDAIGAEGRILCIVDRDDDNAWLSFRNLPAVHTLAADQLNPYDVLVADTLVFTRSTLPTTTTEVAAAPATAAESAAAPIAEVPVGDLAEDEPPAIAEDGAVAEDEAEHAAEAEESAEVPVDDLAEAPEEPTDVIAEDEAVAVDEVPVGDDAEADEGETS